MNYNELIENFRVPAEANGNESLQSCDDPFKIISHSLNFSTLISDLSNWMSQDVDCLVQWINLKLETSNQFAGLDVKDVLESMVIQSIVEAVNRKDVDALQCLGNLFKMLLTAGYLDPQIQEEFKFALCNPAVALQLHNTGLLHIGAQLDLAWNDQEKKMKKFVSEYLSLVKKGEDCSEMTSLLIDLTFNKETPNLRKKRAQNLVEKLLEKILDISRKSEKVIDLSWLGSLHLSDSVIKDWKLFCLSFAMRYGAVENIEVVVKDHENLNIDDITTNNKGIPALIHTLLKDNLLSVEDLTALLSRVLRSAQVNFETLLIFVTCLVNYVQGVVKDLDTVLTKILSQAIHDKDKETFVSGLLVSRHACLQPQFSSYPVWFNSRFCCTRHDESCLINTATDSDFVLDVLTHLVPVDPVFVLRAQLSNQIRCVAKDKLENYRMLARTQLLDLTNLKSSQQPVNQLMPSSLSEAKNLIMEWNNCKKIPAQIMENCMFKVRYFLSQQLPALMTCSLHPDLITARSQLIDQLHSKGKIPAQIYKQFISGEMEEKYKHRVTLSSEGHNTDFSLGEVCLDNLKETLSLLVNLPVEFDQEIQTSLNRLTALLHNLLPASTTLSLDGMMSRHNNDKDRCVREVMTCLLQCIDEVGHQSDVGHQITRILMENKECRDDLMYCFLYHSLSDNSVLLFHKLLHVNPVIQIKENLKIKLQDYIGSDEHMIRSKQELQNLHHVCLVNSRASEPVSLNNEVVILNLCGLRSALAGVSCFETEPMQLQQLQRALLIQLRLMDDDLNEIYIRNIFNKLISATHSDHRNIIDTSLAAAVAAIHSDHKNFSIAASKAATHSEPTTPAAVNNQDVLCDQVAVLLYCLVGLDRSVYLSSAASIAAATHFRTCQKFAAALQQEVDFSDEELNQLMEIIKCCKEATRLLLPLQTISILPTQHLHHFPRTITTSLAHYYALGLIDPEDKDFLRSEYEEVFSWYSNDTSPINTSQTIMVGMMKLGEMLLNGEIDLEKGEYCSFSQQANIINRIIQLADNISQTGVDELLVEASKTDQHLYQIKQSAKMMMLKTFLSNEMKSSSSLYLVIKLIPLLSSLIQSGCLSCVEISILTSYLTRKLDTFPPGEVRERLVRLERECHLDSRLHSLFKPFFHL